MATKAAKEIFKKIRKAEKELADGNFENFNYFLEHSNFLEHTNKDGVDYALEWAAFYGKLDLVKLAVGRGASPNSSNRAAVQMACRNGYLDVAKYLIELGTLNSIPETEILLEVVENNHTDIMEYLLEKNPFGVSICDVHAAYDSALRLAIELNHLPMVKILVKNRADVNVFSGMPLIKASGLGFVDIVKFLIESGADQKYIPEALKRAKEEGKTDVVEYLKKIF